MTVANPLPKNSQPATVAATIATARDRIDGEDYVPVADCLDTLLDCYNAAVRPDVKDVVKTILPSFSVGNVRKVSDFSAALDEIQVALQVDAAFDEVVVDDSASADVVEP